MRLSFQIFQERYKTAPDEIRAVIDSDRLFEFAQKLANQLTLQQNIVPALVRILDSLLLGIVTKEALPQYLKEEASIPEEKISEIGTQMLTFVSHVMPHGTEQAQIVDTTSKPSERTPTTPLESRERLHLRPEAQTAAEAAGWGTAPSVAPMTREKIAESLAPKRTMASDIAAAKGTQSGAPVPTQNPSGEVPRYAKPLTDTR